MEKGVFLLSPSSIDVILRRIGFGVYQVKVFFCLAWLSVTIGAQIKTIPLVSKILEDKWHLNDLEAGFLAGVLFLGMILGTFVSGPVACKLGRKLSLVTGTGSLFVLGLTSAYMPEFWSYLFLRMFLGVAIGFLIPLQTAYETELNTFRNKGSFVIGPFLFLQTGMLFIVLVALWLTPELDSGNWRELIVFASLPSGISLAFQLLWVDESPRHAAESQKFEYAKFILNKIAKTNKALFLNEEELKIVTETKEAPKEPLKKKFSQLLCKKYNKVTWSLFWLYFVSGFVYYGTVFILPRTLFSGETLEDLAVIHSIIPVAILPCFFVNLESFVTATKLMLCIGLQTLGCFVCIFVITEIEFVVLVALIIYLDLLFFNFVSFYASKLYDSEVRSLAANLSNTWTQLAGFLAPFTLLSLHYFGETYPYALICFTSLLGFVTCAILSYQKIQT
mmetsp:Transcript_7883/g.11623  ORF Transcript_7883/g.11623 Transcript_7883/m.11623 type:complete len:448 (-) Transcript_7883:31-1374(-)